MEFKLPDPDKQSRINGELHLQWTASPAHVSSLPPGESIEPNVLATGESAADIAASSVEVEKRPSNLENQLSPEARAAIAARVRPPSRSFDKVTPQKLNGPLPKPTKPAPIRAISDPHKAQRDLIKAKAICNAFNRNVPGFPGACNSVPQ